MQADVLTVISGMQNAIQSWDDVPPADVAITFSSPKWSIIYKGKVIVSGKVKAGDKISGTIWSDGSYCAQVSNVNVSNSWKVRSDIGLLSPGACPSSALGGSGTLPTVTTVTLPMAPGNLRVVNTIGVGNSIDVSWKAVPGATSYLISALGVTPVTVMAPSVKTTIKNITAGEVTVSVRAVSATGAGEASTNKMIVNGKNLFPTN